MDDRAELEFPAALEPPAELESIAALEAHALRAWPATITEATADGWTLRATPGLDRGRCNHALTPCRPLAAAELEPALRRAAEFAGRHGVSLGIQVSPLHLHAGLLDELDARGWQTRWPTVVMVRAAAARPAGGFDRLVLADHTTPDWLAAWARCEGRTESEAAAHAETVFALLRGRATFARLGEDAVALAVGGDGLLGLFCIAVDPRRRRSGLGTRIVTGLLDVLPHVAAYLQVEERNTGAIALYERLGFRPAYRYQHRSAPGV